MMELNTVLSYLYQQYQDDLDLQAFIKAYNDYTQRYVDWANQINLPIYTGLSGKLLDLIGAGVYGLPRPIIGNPSGAIYNSFNYNQANYGSGAILSVTATDDVYKRILTWKLYRGDGFYMSIGWLKRRVKRFLIGINGTAPTIDHTHEVSILIGAANAIEIVVNYPSDPASASLLVQYINSGALDTPYQYTLTARTL
jgi:hypothetical protein